MKSSLSVPGAKSLIVTSPSPASKTNRSRPPLPVNTPPATVASNRSAPSVPVLASGAGAAGRPQRLARAFARLAVVGRPVDVEVAVGGRGAAPSVIEEVDLDLVLP